MTAPRFPSTDAPEARYDAVVSRGRALRRQRRARTLAAGGGGLAAVVLVVGLAVGPLQGGGSEELATTSGDATAEAATATADAPTATATDAAASTTLAAPAAPADPNERSGLAGGDDAVRIDDLSLTAGPTLGFSVVDGARPVGDGSRTCALVELSGPDGVLAAEGFACAVGDEAVAPPTDLVPVAPAGGAAGGAAVVGGAGAAVGCAATLGAEPVATPSGTGAVAVRFRFGVPAGLTPGSYRATVTAVSGIGDGCAPATPGVELERSVSSTSTLTLG